METINTITALLEQPFDCLILVHPQVQILEEVSNQLQGFNFASLNISKELSKTLLSVSANERSRFTQKWLTDFLVTFPNSPVLCICPDLLFDPSIAIDPLALFRQAAKVTQLIILWPGEYSEKKLSYSIPEHHHYRTWNISDSLLRQPVVIIQRISASQGV